MAAASRRSRAAIRKTWPPEAEKLQIASLTGSTSGKAAANVIAACQSARWSPDALDLARLSMHLGR